jgi:hypothetical protein
LLTSTVGIGMITGFGIVEKSIRLGPLTLYNSLRLFARLTPALVTAKQRYKFIQSLTPKPLEGSDDNSSTNIDYLPEAKKILGLLGNGHPDKIVKLAVESDADSVILLQTNGMSVIASAVSSRVSSRRPPPLDQSQSQAGHGGAFPLMDLSIQTCISPSGKSKSLHHGRVTAIPLSVGPTLMAPATPDSKETLQLSAAEASALGADSKTDTDSSVGFTFSPPPIFSMAAAATGAVDIDPFEYYENEVTQAGDALSSASLLLDPPLPAGRAFEDKND